jgi:NRPS condensation-like uncharacterized protein
MSNKRDSHAIFPLPLVPYETMMVRDDRLEYPMTCAAEFKFSGNANREALQHALTKAAERHPLFTSLARERAGGRLVWVNVKRTPPLVWLDEGQHDDFMSGHPIDLTVDVGMRVSVVCGEQVTRLRFDYHHACCDAVGGMAFVEDILVFYALARNQDSQLTPRKLIASSLAGRAKIRSVSTSLLSRLKSAAMAFGKILGLLCQRSLPLVAPRNRKPNTDNDWHSCRYVVREYDESRIRNLRHEAARKETTLNDLMVKCLIRTLRAWQIRHGATDWHCPLRVMIPVNLREKGDTQMPACNKIGYTFVSARWRDMGDENRLLSAIRRTMSDSRRYQLPQWFLQALTTLTRMPRGCFSGVFSAKNCLATAVFTNIADPTRRFSVTFPRERGRLVVGDLLLERITSTAPLRPNTRVVVSVNTYANRLTMTARCDPKYFSRHDAEELLRDFSGRLMGQSPSAERQDADLVAKVSGFA